MRDADPQIGMAIAQHFGAALQEIAGTVPGGLHPAEVCSALAAVIGAHLGASTLSDSPAQVELVLRSITGGAREAMEQARRERRAGR